MQRPKEHQKSKVPGLHGKAKTGHVTSKRRTQKLKHSLKDMENRYIKEEKTHETTMQSVKVADAGEAQGLTEQQQNDREGLTSDTFRTQAKDSLLGPSKALSDDPSAISPT